MSKSKKNLFMIGSQTTLMEILCEMNQLQPIWDEDPEKMFRVVLISWGPLYHRKTGLAVSSHTQRTGKLVLINLGF